MMGLFFLAVGLGQGKQKLGSYEESGGAGKKCGSKFIRVNAHPFAEYLVGEWPTRDQEGEKEDISDEKKNIDNTYGKR